MSFLIINDFNDPGVNRSLWLCLEALEDNVTETFVVFDDAVDTAAPSLPMPESN